MSLWGQIKDISVIVSKLINLVVNTFCFLLSGVIMVVVSYKRQRCLRLVPHLPDQHGRPRHHDHSLLALVEVHGSGLWLARRTSHLFRWLKGLCGCPCASQPEEDILLKRQGKGSYSHDGACSVMSLIGALLSTLPQVGRSPARGSLSWSACVMRVATTVNALSDGKEGSLEDKAKEIFACCH